MRPSNRFETVSTLKNLFEPETTMFRGDAPDWLIDALFEAVQPVTPRCAEPKRRSRD